MKEKINQFNNIVINIILRLSIYYYLFATIIAAFNLCCPDIIGPEITDDKISNMIMMGLPVVSVGILAILFELILNFKNK